MLLQGLMQFHIDIDNGDYIAGWMLPDNPSATPVIAVSIENGETVRIPANVFRKDLKDLGIHHTGMLGFEFNGAVVPGLKESAHLEIRDAETNFLIFRRFREAKHLRCKLLFCELSAMPQLPIDASIGARFAISYNAVERCSFDTLFGIINNQSTPSVYLNGRPHLTRYLQLIRDRGFKSVAILRDPIEELAEKLVFLKFATSEKAASFVTDYLTGLAPLLEMSRKFDLGDDNSVVSMMNSLGEAELHALSNPFVRVLGCAADEIAQAPHVSIALENLANLDLVGVRTRFDRFKRELATILGDDLLGEQTPALVSSVPALATKLGRLRSVHKLLALDIKLYRFVAEAIENAYDKPGQPR